MMSTGRRISAFMTRPFPQNIIIRRPLPSALTATAACYLFLMVYQPLGMLRSDYSNYEFTMGVYSLICGSWFIIMAVVIKRIPFFREEWTLGREILAILVVIVPLGSIIWAAGFVMEDPEGRMSLTTYLDSCFKTTMVAGVPFAVTSLLSAYSLRRRSLDVPPAQETDPDKSTVHEIRIETLLKNQDFSLDPESFVFAEAEGNYVVFHLLDGQDVRKEVLRCTLSSTEEQLSAVPFLLRTHRAFIVNLKMVDEADGNALGYTLRLRHVDGKEIPVSRSRVDDFRKRFRRIHHSRPRP